MGEISAKLVKRLGRSRKLADEFRRGAGSIRRSLDALSRGVSTQTSRGDTLDPLHAVYVAVQHATSVFSERVSSLAEFKPYYQLVEKAEDEYMPEGPPMSPLTRSYFTTWAFFDLRFGPDGETIGTCLLDAGTALGFEPGALDVIRTCAGTRMGVYEHAGLKIGELRLPHAARSCGGR
jgi:hypothetical protein